VSVSPFPEWARWAWAAFFVLTVFEHLPHLGRMHGARRLWHLGHVVMAVGMAWMFIPPEYRDATRWPWQVLYGATSVLAVGYALARLVGGATIDLSWIAMAVGQVGMWYMWSMRDGVAREWLTYVGAAWFVVEAVGWFTGELTGRRDPSYIPKAVGARAGDSPFLGGAKPLAYAVKPLARLSLGLMAVGMAYMLIGMQIELCRTSATCN
jgi:hypothetical protein